MKKGQVIEGEAGAKTDLGDMEARHKTRQDTNPQKFMLGELMLYRPTTKEIDKEQIESLYDDMYGEKRKVDIVKNKVMEHLQGTRLLVYTEK